MLRLVAIWLVKRQHLEACIALPLVGLRHEELLAKVNDHVTVKPIDLMRYLVRMVTPKGGTVLDPFMGSGTTGIAAALEKVGFIGVEREADYFTIASARIRARVRAEVVLADADEAADIQP